MKKFLRGQDVLGATPQMSYKKETTFGTSCGGCCSLIANITLVAYMIVMLIGFLVEPSYNLAQT